VKNHSNSLWLFVLAGLVVSTTMGCQTGPKIETEITEGPGSVVVVQTIRLQATVVAIDATHRTVRLQPRHGDPKTFRVGKDAVNFQQVRVGDEVHAIVIEETAITLVSGGAPPSVGQAAGVALAPVGARPGAVMVNTVEAIATIVAIDGHEHTVTLEFLDGRIQEVDVGKHRDLSKVGLGDSVRIQITEAVALSVVKP
jgi:hypothetical protein